MPIYIYKCTHDECDKTREVRCSVADRDSIDVPCVHYDRYDQYYEVQMERILPEAINIAFKGEGFYCNGG